MRRKIYIIATSLILASLFSGCSSKTSSAAEMTVLKSIDKESTGQNPPSAATETTQKGSGAHSSISQASENINTGKISNNGFVFPDGLELLFEKIPSLDDAYANYEVDFWYTPAGEFIRGTIEVDALQSYDSENLTQWYSTQTLRIAEDGNVMVETKNDSGWARKETYNGLPCWAPESNTLLTICDHTINKVIKSYNHYDLADFFKNLNIENAKEYRIVNDLMEKSLFEQFDLSEIIYKLPDGKLVVDVYAETIVSSEIPLTVYPAWLYVIPYDAHGTALIDNVVMISGQEAFE